MRVRRRARSEFPLRQKHEKTLAEVPAEERFDRFCELNVIEQVKNVCHTTVIQQAWDRGQSLAVHGWIYRIQDGLIRDLDVTIQKPDEIAQAYRLAANIA